MIITIDGSAGSGKSTAARKLAARLGVAYLDTGAMYRAIAWSALERGIDYTDPAVLLAAAREVDMELDCGPTHTRIRVDGRDVSEAVRSMAVSGVTPYVARHQGIRALLVERQQEIGQKLGSLVAEGRDQGSVVFPEAQVKFVVDASVQVRARRRLADLVADGEEVRISAVIDNLHLRDRDDSKQWEPLLAAGEAIVVDTSNLTLAEVVDLMAERVAGACADSPAGGMPASQG